MKKRLFYFLFVFTLILFVILHFYSCKKTKPNVFFIVSNVNKVNVLGNSDSYLVPTPSIDKLRSQGIEFLKCFGIGSTSEEIERSMFSEMPSSITSDFNVNDITNKFSRLGYEILIVGDWTLKSRNDIDSKSIYPKNRYLYDKEGRNINDSENSIEKIEVFVQQINDFMRTRNKKKPFLILLNQNLDLNRVKKNQAYNQNKDTICKKYVSVSPNLSVLNKPVYWQKSVQTNNDTSFVFDTFNYSSIFRNYFASILSIDFNLGRVIQTLKDNNVLDNTILISALIEQLYDNKQFGKNSCGFSHIDLIMTYPAQIEKNIKSDVICLATDIYPTILDLCGEEIPAQIKQNSLLPIIKNDGLKPFGWRGFFYFENKSNFNGKSGCNTNGISTNRYRLVNNIYLNKWEFYDLYIDPLETNNVYNFAKYRCVRDSMLDLFLDYKVKNGIRY